MGDKRRDKGDGSIYQRKSDGLWIAKYTHTPGKKPKVLYGKTELEAKKKLREYKKEIAASGFPEKNKTTVKQYMDNWFYTVKKYDLKPKSIDSLESTLRNHVYPYIEGIQVGALTSNDVRFMILES